MPRLRLSEPRPFSFFSFWILAVLAAVLAVDPHGPAHIVTGTYDGSLFTHTVPR